MLYYNNIFARILDSDRSMGSESALQQDGFHCIK